MREPFDYALRAERRNFFCNRQERLDFASETECVIGHKFAIDSLLKIRYSLAAPQGAAGSTQLFDKLRVQQIAGFIPLSQQNWVIGVIW